MTSQLVAEGRAAFARDAWVRACELFTAAEAEAPLEPEDLDRLATAEFLIGRDEESIDARTRAHAAHLERGDKIGAAASAYWLIVSLHTNPARRAQVSGWFARARRLLDECGQRCVVEGWLTAEAAFQRVMAGEFAEANAMFARAAQIGSEFGDRDLTALARHGEGRSLLMLNRTGDGIALLDEVMISVTGGEVGPIVTGIVYCSVLSACHDLFDLRRAHEWTEALQRWCEAHPDLNAFRGDCRVRRSELIQLHGAWDDAVDEAQRACARLSETNAPPFAAAAYYQMAELHRLRGDFAQAEESYRLATQRGRSAAPGLALLRLSQGDTEAAASAIRLALRDVRNRRIRVDTLDAAVDILLAAGDRDGARAACDELRRLAEAFDAPFVRALWLHASAAMSIADGNAAGALEALHDAATFWQEINAPYELACNRVLLGLAHRELGDRDGALLEFDAAQEMFEKLGAAPDAARVAKLAAAQPQPAGNGLTGREVEVLRLIATGATNRAIGDRLGIREKTVARHVSNIFTKLDLTSRAAATAYAYEHKLI